MREDRVLGPATASLGLADWGWDDRWEAAFREHARPGLVPGRVSTMDKGTWRVATAEGELTVRLAGRLRHDASSLADLPAVGDWVALEPRSSEGGGTIHVVLPRRSRFSRLAGTELVDEQVVAANVDLALLVAALDHEFNPRRLERYFATAWSSGAEPALILNKADVADDVTGKVTAARAVAGGAAVHVISARTGLGLDVLRSELRPGRTIAFLGSSGVGKSTLTNALLGVERQDTGGVRLDDSRGRHTTTRRELIPAPNGSLLLDTPGLRALALWDAGEGLVEAFDDITRVARGCRFSDCTHHGEPGCAVLAAVASGELDRGRLEGQRKLEREQARMERIVDPRAREEHRRRWKNIQSSVRVHMKQKYGDDGR